MTDIFLILIVLIFLLVLSSIFSSSETAFFNLKLHREGIDEKVKKMMQDPKRLLVSLLTGNAMTNIAIAFFPALIANRYFENNNTIISIQVFLISMVILIFGEILPKKIALRNSEKFSMFIYKPIKIIFLIIRPISSFFYFINNSIMSLIPSTKEKIFDSEEELIMLAELGEEQGTIHEEESEMIQSIFEFNDKTVHGIMTPRVDSVMISSDSSIDSAMDLIKEKKFSKIPIYKDNTDNIRGILYAKDLLPYLTGSRPNVDLISLARPTFFIPESKPIDDLLDDFKLRKTSIAVVVDEWGGTSGLVTVEDVVEEVMGEFIDPYDDEKSPIQSIGNNIHLISASINIYDVEEEFEIKFPEDRDYDTLGGFIFDRLNDIPKGGESVIYSGFKFLVEKIIGNRIDKIRLEKIIEK